MEKRRRREAKNLPAGTYLKLCRDGFFPNKKELYQFSRYDRAQYISDQQMLMTAYINGEQAVLLNDKVLFKLVMGPFVHVPHNFAFVGEGRFISLDPEIKDLSDVKALLVRHRNLIVKPTSGLGGKGITLLQYGADGFLSNRRKRRWREISRTLLTAGDVIICEYIRQGQFANHLYPHTVNTIRMLSMRDPETGTSFIAAAAFRIGCSRSIPVDNISAGGLVCDIDLASGCLGKAATGFFGKGAFQWLEKHPDTGVRLEGLTLEGWDRICKKIQGVVDKFPYLPYIAWDVALGDDDIVVVEGNAWSDVSLFQIYRPLLRDRRIGAFLKHHQII
ncbi:MAG: hypothetical protein JJV98_00220 [Desulfosarcina sp.]|nr:hypothetical protein [Desulfobacterales bacterium]